MTPNQNPFSVGDRVAFVPDDRTIGWTWSSFDRLRLHPGDEGMVSKIEGDFVFVDDDRGGFHFECFEKVP